MPKILKRSAAQRDLVAHFMYLAENASVSVADRFLTCVDTSIQQLAQHSRDHGISIVRVLHAARNWWQMLKLVQ